MNVKTKSITEPPKCYLDTEVEIVDWLLDCFTKNDKKRFAEIDESAGKTNHKKTKNKTLDCSIMDIADEISYGVHDLEDGIQIGMIERDHLTHGGYMQGQNGKTLKDLFESTWGIKWGLKDAIGGLFSDSNNRKSDRKSAIGAIVHALIGSVDYAEDNMFEHPILRLNATLEPEAKQVLKHIKAISFKEVMRALEKLITKRQNFTRN